MAGEWFDFSDFSGGENYWDKKRQEQNIKRQNRLKGSFDKQLQEFIGNITQRTILGKREMARQALSYMIKLSPVWTGAYVKSHKVGVNSVDGTFEQPDPFMNLLKKKTEAQAYAIKAETEAVNTAKLQAATRIFDEIYISNSAPHAMMVEYIGWKKTGPYHIYKKTQLKVKSIGANIIKGNAAKL